MAQVECFFNGSFVPIQTASIPISDLGFIHGITVTEQLRTFGGVPFLLSEHLNRFDKGLQTIGIDLQFSSAEIRSIVLKTISKYLAATGNTDCGVGFFATPGGTSRFGQIASEAQFCVYGYALPNEYSAEFYRQGVKVSVVDIQDTVPENWPKSIKLRSRAHYYLADLQAKTQGALPLLCGAQHDLKDSSNASPVYVFESGKISVPCDESVLDSISLNYICRLAEKLGMQVERRRIGRDEADHVRSMALVNSLYCMVKVETLNSRPLEMKSVELDKLFAAWFEDAGLDFTQSVL